MKEFPERLEVLKTNTGYLARILNFSGIIARATINSQRHRKLLFFLMFLRKVEQGNVRSFLSSFFFS